MEKFLEAKRDPRVTKLHNEYAEKIANAEQLYDYTKCGNDAVGAYKEYERQIHAAEDFLDNGKRELYSDFRMCETFHLFRVEDANRVSELRSH